MPAAPNYLHGPTALLQGPHDCRDISVAILAGGLGTRLRPALANYPKALAPVCGRPFVTRLLDQLADASFQHVVLLTGYRADQVRETLGDSYRSLKLAYSRETAPLGTAGAVRQALPKLTGETILVMNGDSFCEVDLPALVAEHRRRQADLTMTLTQAPDPGRFGAVRFQPDGRITSFVEKQVGNGPGWINAGIYVLAKSLMESIPAGKAASFERALLPEWLKSRRVLAFPTPGRFLDIGTPASYAEAEAFFESTPRIRSTSSWGLG